MGTSGNCAERKDDNTDLCLRCKDGYGLGSCDRKGCRSCIKCGENCNTCRQCVCTACIREYVTNVIDPNNCIDPRYAFSIPDQSDILKLMEETTCVSKMINLNIVLLLILLFLLKK